MDPDIIRTITEGPARIQWETVGFKHHHGVAIPLFSLHSKSSCGIGEFSDLVPLFPWCSSVGIELIQLLPLNDTGQETSPYSALTAFALNPIHLGLQELSLTQGDASLQKQVLYMQRLTKCQRIPYSQVLKEKDVFLRCYYKLAGGDSKTMIAFHEFKKRNAHWCYDYALFKAIKIKTSWQSWEQWPKKLESLSQELIEEVDFHQFVQYLCFEQFEKVKNTGATFGVKLKGDIPILINRESADVWAHTPLFDLQYSAGAPPDMYAEEGQKWGFPLYNWDALAAENYLWWIDRLRTAALFYDIYRIDHIVGFYRIWGIPIDLAAIQGSFIPADKSTWIAHGETILRVMLQECDMLPIGEDLGTVPPEVRKSLSHLGICGTKVMRWERRWDEDRGYIDPADYPVESMTTVSTHDSETLGQWWTKNPDEAELFAAMLGLKYEPQLSLANRQNILTASHQSASLFHINLLNEYLAIFPDMIWPNPEDERINVPGTIDEKNWSYRFRPSVEEIVKSRSLTEVMREIIRPLD